MFRPYVHRIMPPRSTAVSDASSNSPSQQTLRSVVFPIGRLVDLSAIGASGRRDYFLWHPYQNSLQDVVIGVENPANAPPGFRCQLVQVDGEVTRILTAETPFVRFNVRPDSLPLPAEVLDGPVFLRVAAPTTPLRLYVTVFALTGEVL